ncbi:MAG: helix-turn-helix transcriptional regulator [Planctomycetes bacterium]|nr:helix-turn-helix transcriptional regulator [Planctomycetota bacterium]
MEIDNKPFAETARAEPNGVLTIPLDVPYRARLLHATYRNRNQPGRGARNPHKHDVYHVVLVTGGAGRFVIGQEERVAVPGQLFLTSPGEWHSFGSEIGENSEYCEATFEFRAAEPASPGRRGLRKGGGTRAQAGAVNAGSASAANGASDAGGAVLTIPMHEIVAAWTGRPCRAAAAVSAPADLHLLIMEEIERMVRAGFARERNYELTINAGLARILLALYEHVFSERAAPAAAEGLPAAREYLHKHYNEPVGLPELARLAGCSPNYLSRRFKALYGATPIVYQHRLRMTTAAQLLQTTQYPIKQIAELVGFGDVYFFSRIFRKLVGAPPGRYRKTGGT